MTTAVLITVFGASMLGSLHCAGMCGGFVAFYAGALTPREAGWRALFASLQKNAAAHVAYNGGRLLVYTVLGGLAGALGSALDLAGKTVGLSRAAVGASGVLIIGWGTVHLLQAMGMRIPRPAFLRGVTGSTRWTVPLLRRAAGRPPVIRAGLIGLCSALLPCGWLYAFVATAAGTASAVYGAATMAIFWLGTVPMMTTVGISIQTMAGPLRRHLPKLSAVALIVVGSLALAGKLDVPSPVEARSANSHARATGAAGSVVSDGSNSSAHAAGSTDSLLIIPSEPSCHHAKQ